MTRRRSVALMMMGLAGCVVEEGEPEGGYAAIVEPNGEGGEATRCATIELENREPIEVSGITVSFAGAERVVVYLGDGDGGGCGTFGGGRAPLMIAVASGQTSSLPPGVGFRLVPHQRLHVELYAEAGLAGNAGAEIQLDVAAEPIDHAAGTMFLETAEFELAPNGARLADAYLVPPAHLAAAHFVSFTGHTRRRGVGVNVAMVADRIADKVPVHLGVPFRWDAPDTTSAPPRQLTPGGAFYLQCLYYNTSPHPVRAGDGADDEVCGFWTTYYPAAAGDRG